MYEEENKKLKERLTYLELETTKSRNEQLTLEQENERLYIRVQDMESRYSICNNDINKFDVDKKLLDEDIVKLKLENQQLKNERSKLEFEVKKLEQKFGLALTEQKLYFANLVGDLKQKYKKKIRELEDQLTELNEKYNDKKLNETKKQKALDHLRNHFMISCSNYENDDRIADSLIK